MRMRKSSSRPEDLIQRTLFQHYHARKAPGTFAFHVPNGGKRKPITLAEIFLNTGKLGTPLQSNAETAAILTSLLLQHGVAPDVIRHSVAGPIAVALAKFGGEQ